MNETLTMAESGIHLALDGPGRVVDVGAHLGRFSIPLMQNPEIRVLAFEPVPWVRGDLITRIRDELAIAPSKFRVMPQALGDQCGRTRMSIPLLGGWPVLEWASIAKDFNAIAARNPSHDLKSVEIEVEVRTLDAFGVDDLCGLKVDAEGAELSVLRGARETIARCRPFISCELEERHAEGCTWAVPAFLDALGYDGFFIHAGRLHPVAALERAWMQCACESPGGRDYSVPYVFEFYFIHRSQPGRRQTLVDLLPGGYAERVDASRT
jgi:FkbM family methyltransferase